MRDSQRQAAYAAERRVMAEWYEPTSLLTANPSGRPRALQNLTLLERRAARVPARQADLVEARRYRAAVTARLRAAAGAVLESRWWYDHQLPQTVTVRLNSAGSHVSRGGLYASGYGISMATTSRALSAPVVVHELAHVAQFGADRRNPGGRYADPGHGPIWRGALVRLVHLTLGEEVADQLQGSFYAARLAPDLFAWREPTEDGVLLARLEEIRTALPPGMAVAASPADDQLALF